MAHDTSMEERNVTARTLPICALPQPKDQHAEPDMCKRFL